MNENKLKRWAVMADGMRITSIWAVTEAQAKEQAHDGLDRPGRRALLRRWEECGCEVVEINE